MQRLMSWLLWWMVLFSVFHNFCNGQTECPKNSTPKKDKPGNNGNSQGASKKKKLKDALADTKNSMDVIKENGTKQHFVNLLKNLEEDLNDANEMETTSMSVTNVIAVLYKPKQPFKKLIISANETVAKPQETVPNYKASVEIPEEVDAGPNNTICFYMITCPETMATMLPSRGVLYENRLVGMSVSGKNISGLKERVNITMNLTTNISEAQIPTCMFLNFSTSEFSSDGCLTLWECGQSHITCSCDHLSVFCVLMVPSSLSPKDTEILTYITLIGCSLSLVTLVISVMLFITNKKLRADVSMKIHINLAMALILLNIYFLPSQRVAALPSAGLCFYMGLSLHYSLLASFSWMALEGFHLYLLLVRVFNIYIKRYLLKLSLVGWGIPAVIVSLVVIIGKDPYGSVSLDASKSNDTSICYIKNDTVRVVTTVGFFGLIFIFNIVMLGVTIRRIVILSNDNEFGQCDRDGAKRAICVVVGVTALLGITWGLIFFSFGAVATPALYLFCILNPLQGFFIFLWFVMSLRKNRKSDVQMSTETSGTNN
ncbi:adhesion G-protein coupled receptor G5-like [Mastacembelus armatus]|uniref:adhesion G-protein coupled receptor G5-like n=1 Tax=Mastacembelus armatus TaxID=205130 RepID=UPI000E4615BA|nr:adhesion G-protein coupled receptor G5-like [Mastacembelus armatus]